MVKVVPTRAESEVSHGCAWWDGEILCIRPEGGKVGRYEVEERGDGYNLYRDTYTVYRLRYVKFVDVVGLKLACNCLDAKMREKEFTCKHVRGLQSALLKRVKSV